MIPRAAAPLAAIALAAGALGCGGDGDEGSSFKDDYLAESAEIGAVGKEVGQSLRSTTRRSEAELARRWTGLARLARESVGDLRRLDPPEALVDERDELAEAVAAGAADLRHMAAAARAGDRREQRSATRKLIEDSEDIRAARGKLNKLALKE